MLHLCKIVLIIIIFFFLYISLQFVLTNWIISRTILFTKSLFDNTKTSLDTQHMILFSQQSTIFFNDKSLVEKQLRLTSLFIYNTQLNKHLHSTYYTRYIESFGHLYIYFTQKGVLRIICLLVFLRFVSCASIDGTSYSLACCVIYMFNIFREHDKNSRRQIHKAAHQTPLIDGLF